MMMRADCSRFALRLCSYDIARGAQHQRRDDALVSSRLLAAGVRRRLHSAPCALVCWHYSSQCRLGADLSTALECVNDESATGGSRKIIYMDTFTPIRAVLFLWASAKMFQ